MRRSTSGHGGWPVAGGLVMLTVLGAPCVGLAQSAPNETRVELAKKIQWLETRIPAWMDAADIPGLQAAVVFGKDTIWRKSYGVKSRAAGEPLNDETLFDGASLSKPVIAYTVMRLVDRGVFDLDTPLTRYRPYLDVKGDERVNEITARMVLSHTTGFPNWRPRGGDLAIYFDPGTRFSYSGEGLVFLEQTLEHVTGQALGALVKREVFDPLGMARSRLGWTSAEPPDNLALGHDKDGTPVGFDASGGRIVNTFLTTASEYARFVSAVLSGTGLTPESRAEMLRPQVAFDKNCTPQRDYRGWPNCTRVTGSPRLSEDSFWALGWGVEETPSGRFFWQWGDQGIYRHYVAGSLDQPVALVYLTNGFGGLSIRDVMVTHTLGGTHPAFGWLLFEQVDEEHDPVRQAIERGYAQYVKSFGQADAAGVAGVYDERGARLYGGGRVVRGREAIRKDVARFIERVGPVTVTIEIDEFWVMDDKVYETGRWTYVYTPEGQEERTSRGRYLTTWKRQADGGWKMWADMALP